MSFIRWFIPSDWSMHTSQCVLCMQTTDDVATAPTKQYQVMWCSAWPTKKIYYPVLEVDIPYAVLSPLKKSQHFRQSLWWRSEKKHWPFFSSASFSWDVSQIYLFPCLSAFLPSHIEQQKFPLLFLSSETAPRVMFDVPSLQQWFLATQLLTQIDTLGVGRLLFLCLPMACHSV